MAEIWRPIAEADDYEVSSLGRVRRCKPDKFGRGVGKVLATPLNDKGYPNLNLHIAGVQKLRRVHRLVCQSFHGDPPEGKPEVRHLNGIKTDNRPENLAWGSSTENKLDITRHGRKPPKVGRRLKSEEVVAIRLSQATHTELARLYGVSRPYISAIKGGRRRAAAGY